MSLSDKHTISSQTIEFGPAPIQPKNKNVPEKEDSDSVYFTKKVNGFDLRVSSDSSGKLEFIADKKLGRLGSMDSDSIITIRLETTQAKVPQIKIVEEDSIHQPLYLEINDEKNIVSPDFDEKQKDYKREWQNSSILSPEQYFQEQIPDFQALISDTKVTNYISKISESCSNVCQGFTRQYRRLVK